MRKKFFSMILNMVLYFFIFLCCLPIFILTITSFIDTWIYPNIIPESFTLAHFQYVFSEGLSSIILTSSILGILCGVLTILVSLPVARALALYDFPFKIVVSLFVLLPLIVPSFTSVSISHIVMIRTSIASTLVGVCIIHSVFALPYAIKILYDATLSMGIKYEEQAKNLGASWFRVMRTVYLPLMSPYILMSFFLSFTISISQYVTTLIIGGGKVATLSTVLVPYIQYGKYQLASIYSLIIVVMTFISYFLISRLEKKFFNF